MANGLRIAAGRFIGSRASLLVTLGALSLACSERSVPTGAPTGAPTGSATDGDAQASTVSASESRAIPGQYIITFADSVSDVPGLANRIAAQYGNAPLHTYTDAIKGFAARIPDQAIEGLSHNPNITRIEADQEVHASDTQSGAVWNLDRLDQRTRSLDGNYNYAATGAGVNAYIMDSGIRLTHTEFAGRAFSGYSAVNDGRGTNDCTGHGTHVAGTVGGTRYGVAKSVKLYAVRVFDCSGYASWSSVLSAIDWVTKNRVLPAVVNMSIEGPKSSTVNAAVQTMINSGVVVVAAAGNDAGDACSFTPASTPEALTIGSSWNFDGMSGFSNFGSCVDLFAPGEAIRSAYFVSDTASVLKGGTSMAAPHVAGVAALYLSANPSATPAQVAAAILSGATSNVLTSVPAGTPNLLLYSGITGASSPPPVDTTTAPPADTTTPPPPTGATPAPDLPPVATFTANCARSKCTLDGSGSADDYGIVTYAWSFGDASASASGAALQRVIHTYSSTGSFTVTLTVTDTAGQKSSKSATVIVKRL